MTDRTRSYGPAALGGRLRRLSESIDEDAGRIYADSGVDCEQRWVGLLEELAKRGPRSVGELAETLGIRHSSVSQARNSLEKAGLICSLADPQDARSRKISLSAAGRARVRQLAPLWKRLNKIAVELDREAGRAVAALNRLDAALRRKSLYDRFRDSQRPSVKASPVKRKASGT